MLQQSNEADCWNRGARQVPKQLRAGPLLCSAVTFCCLSYSFQSFLLTKGLYNVELPVKDIESGDKKKTTRKNFPMILPHELLCYLIAASLHL